jgi:hypothetical protein
VLTLAGGLPSWATPAAGGMANPMTTAGDIITGGASGAAQRLAKGSDGQILQLVSGAPAWAAAPSGAVAPFDSTHPDAAPASPNAADDEFTGAAIDTSGTRRSGATAWTLVNQGSNTVTQGQSHLLLKRTGSAPSANSIFSVVQSLPSQTCKYRAKLALSFKNADCMAGMVLRDSASSKIIEFVLYSGSSLTLKVLSYTSNTSAGTTVNSASAADTVLYLEIEQDASNRIYRYSANGVEGSFVDLYSETKTTFITPDQIGVFINPFGAPMCAAFDFFRRIS